MSTTIRYSPKHGPVTLKLPADTRYVPTLIQCVQSAGENFGFPSSVFTGLSVAAEEIFAKVAGHHGETLVEAVMRNGIYRFVVDLTFLADALDWRGFNITGDAVDLEEGDVEELGLLIAARMTDHLSLYREGTKAMGVRIERHLPHESIKPLPPDPVLDGA
ncbi:MAG: ATP-binding protein, partial [Candidatus Competibacteraceae bacterium]|nr:ATP-binding protein [Candidatus Competibacteraceae bacterium]